MTFEEIKKFSVWCYFCVIRRSSRKRTFSMSPTSSTAKKDQEEQKTVKESQENENICPVTEKEMTNKRRSSKGPENSDVSVKTASQKQESRKSKVPSCFVRFWCKTKEWYFKLLIWFDWYGLCYILWIDIHFYCHYFCGQNRICKHFLSYVVMKFKEEIKNKELL